MSARIVFVFVALGLVACGTPSVDDICEDLNSDCDGVVLDDCIDDGKLLQKEAESRGCPDVFEEYVECIDDEQCGWEDACVQTRTELAQCVGETP